MSGDPSTDQEEDVSNLGNAVDGLLDPTTVASLVKSRPMVCQVDGCGVDLSQVRKYFQRYRVCELHLKAQSLHMEGTTVRFCDQCSKFHPLTMFDGNRRTCNDKLERTRQARSDKRRQQSAQAQRAAGRAQGRGGSRQAQAGASKRPYEDDEWDEDVSMDEDALHGGKRGRLPAAEVLDPASSLPANHHLGAQNTTIILQQAAAAAAASAAATVNAGVYADSFTSQEQLLGLLQSPKPYQSGFGSRVVQGGSSVSPHSASLASACSPYASQRPDASVEGALDELQALLDGNTIGSFGRSAVSGPLSYTQSPRVAAPGLQMVLRELCALHEAAAAGPHAKPDLGPCNMLKAEDAAGSASLLPAAVTLEVSRAGAAMPFRAQANGGGATGGLTGVRGTLAQTAACRGAGGGGGGYANASVQEQELLLLRLLLQARAGKGQGCADAGGAAHSHGALPDTEQRAQSAPPTDGTSWARPERGLGLASREHQRQDPAGYSPAGCPLVAELRHAASAPALTSPRGRHARGPAQKARDAEVLGTDQSADELMVVELLATRMRGAPPGQGPGPARAGPEGVSAPAAAARALSDMLPSIQVAEPTPQRRAVGSHPGRDREFPALDLSRPAAEERPSTAPVLDLLRQGGQELVRPAHMPPAHPLPLRLQANVQLLHASSLAGGMSSRTLSAAMAGDTRRFWANEPGPALDRQGAGQAPQQPQQQQEQYLLERLQAERESRQAMQVLANESQAMAGLAHFERVQLPDQRPGVAWDGGSQEGCAGQFKHLLQLQEQLLRLGVQIVLQ